MMKIHSLRNVVLTMLLVSSCQNERGDSEVDADQSRETKNGTANGESDTIDPKNFPSDKATIFENGDTVSIYFGRDKYVVTKEQFELRPAKLDDTRWGVFLSVYLDQVKSNGPINFFGRIVDENGNGLSDVEVEIEIGSNETNLSKVLKRDKYTRENTCFTVTTDKNGKFSISDEEGTSLVLLKFTKKGYQIVGKTWYSIIFNQTNPERHEGDPENPVVYTMKKIVD